MRKREIVGYSVLAVMLLLLLYIHNNPAKVYSDIGNFYYKHNNISTSQIYFEKAFASGVTTPEVRDLYVNTIINSPFDTKAQRKLEKFLEIPIEDDAKAKAFNFLVDFRRAIYKNYPENYITQTVYNQKVIRWCTSPITYGFVHVSGVPDYFIKEIEAAFTQWENVTEHQLLFTRNDENPSIIIDFNLLNKIDENSRKYVVAYTTPELNVNQLVNMTINFYLKDANGEYYSANQVYNTALHEIAHALGFMGHSSDIEDVMHSTKDSKSVMNDERIQLSQADINTIKMLYQIEPDITNVTTPTGKYTPFLILGGTQRIQKAKMREAVTYVQNAPNIAGGYIDLADGYLANKDYENAKKALRKALKLADSNELRAMIYYNLGVVYYYSDDYQKAHKCLSAALSINESDDSRYLLAEIYYKGGQVEDAIKEYEGLIKHNPNNIDYTIGLANLYVKERKYMNARKVLKNYLKANPSEKNNARLKSYGILTLFL